MEEFASIAGLVSSILGILAFFGFARYADVTNLFANMGRIQAAPEASQTGEVVQNRSVVRGLVAGVIGYLIEGPARALITNIENLPLPSIDFTVEELSKGAAINAFLICIGWKLRKPMSAAIAGVIVSRGLTLYAGYNREEFERTDFELFMDWATGIASGAVYGVGYCLIGAAGNALFGGVIGFLSAFFLTCLYTSASPLRALKVLKECL